MNLMKTIIKFIALALFTHIGILHPAEAQKKPIGTVKVNNVYFDQTEVTVGAWLSYYSWVLKNRGYEEAKKILPDSSAVEPAVWQYIKTSSPKYDDYLILPTNQPLGHFQRSCNMNEDLSARLRKGRICPLLYLPITGISYEQAFAFCLWRTEMQGNYHYKFEYRLPTPEEWKEFALSGLSQSEKTIGLRDSMNMKGCPLFNYFGTCDCENSKFQGKLNDIGRFDWDQNHIFDVFGNVSEMTSIKGVSKGGNYQMPANRSHVDSVQHYTKPEKWLGFRCVVYRRGASSTPFAMQHTVNKEVLDGDNGTLTDARDGKEYKIKKIGSQIWINENMRFIPPRGHYYMKENDNSYRYNWEAAQDVCPCGWRLPGKEDAISFLNNFEGPNLHSKLIKNDFSNYSYWTSSNVNNKMAWGLCIGSESGLASGTYEIQKKVELYVRCIKNE